jgi:hypothetical protein
MDSLVTTQRHYRKTVPPTTSLKSTSKRGGGGLIEYSSVQPSMWSDLLELNCVMGDKSDWKSLSEKPQMRKVTSMD